MQVQNMIVINQKIDLIWKVLAQDFAHVHRWASPVKHSYALSDAQAPFEGRVCQFTQKENGLAAIEKITHMAPQAFEISFSVEPVNAPIVFPLKNNSVAIKLTDLGKQKTQVDWCCDINLKPAAKLFSPLLRMGMKASFNALLKELKDYSEQQVENVQVEQALLIK
ncbi:SRPBCC family protein [Motilimonas pumila]|nr:SRPBCC family protein [Motilimonas pumila]